MTAFGSAIGLSLVSPYEGPSPQIFYIALALWFVWITVSSFAVGGYVTGRMRRRINDSTIHEIHIRDGGHGLVVWAVSVLLGAAIGISTVSFAVKGTADVAKSGVSSVASNMGAVTDPMGYAVDSLLRNPGNPADKNGLANSPAITGDTRQEVMRILAMSVANGSLSNDDRGYLAKLVAARTGLSQTDAEKRVDQVSARIKSVSDKAKDTAEMARKGGIILAFLTAASMVLGAAAAWWGAVTGGRHRDENYDASNLTRW